MSHFYSLKFRLLQYYKYFLFIIHIFNTICTNKITNSFSFIWEISIINILWIIGWQDIDFQSSSRMICPPSDAMHSIHPPFLNSLFCSHLQLRIQCCQILFFWLQYIFLGLFLEKDQHLLVKWSGNTEVSTKDESHGKQTISRIGTTYWWFLRLTWDRAY